MIPSASVLPGLMLRGGVSRRSILTGGEESRSMMRGGVSRRSALMSGEEARSMMRGAMKEGGNSVKTECEERWKGGKGGSRKRGGKEEDEVEEVNKSSYD